MCSDIAATASAVTRCFLPWRTATVPGSGATVEVDTRRKLTAISWALLLNLLSSRWFVVTSTHELERDLNSRFGAKYLQNPQVTVSVKQFNSARVIISGAVKNPGVFPYKGETLLQFITMAGGLSSESNSMMLVLRQSNGGRSAAKFNVDDIQNGRTNDPVMQPGDLIVADSSPVKHAAGAVNTYVLTPIMRVLPLAFFAGL